MRILRNYKAEHWNALTFNTEDDWQKGFEIFMDRLTTPYVLHIQLLLRHRTRGFAVLTLDCALIETLEQFRRGISEIPRGQSQEHFATFLTEAFIFSYAGNEMNLVKLPYIPNPSFQPPSREAKVFHELQGEMWGEPTQRRLVRMRGHVIADVKFGGGL